MHIRVKIIAFCLFILSSLCVMTSAFADTTFTTEQRMQMALAWSSAGRNINDFAASLNAWGALGGSYDDFIKTTQTAPPNWNPSKSYAEMTSTLANGYVQYTDTERLQMGAAWLPRDVNNYAAAINAWATLGGTPNDFIQMAQSKGPDWNPAQDLTNMETAWILSGHNLEDFLTAYQAASKLGMSPNDIIAAIKNDPNWDPGIEEERQRQAEEERQRQLAEQQRLAEENAQLLEQYYSLRDELKKYNDLWNEVNDKKNNNQDIDWNNIAERLGIEPSTPDDIYKRLEELNYYHEVWNQIDQGRAASGQSPEDFMRWLTGQTPGADGKTCTETTGCYSQTRAKLDAILTQPGIKPPDMPSAGAGGFSGSDKNFFDLSYLLEQFHTQLPAIIHLLYALSYTIGFLLVIIALLRLKEYSSSSSQYRQSGLVTSCLSYLMAGVMLIYLPSALEVGAATFLADNGDNSLFSYTVVKNKGFGYEELITPVLDIIKIVGLLAFIRGWIMLSKMGNEQHKGVMFKGIVHVIGGILAVNIIGVYTIFARVFGRLLS